MKTNLEIVEEVISLLKKKENWIQHAYARDKNGDRVNPLNPDAHCYCSLGALDRVAENASYPLIVELFNDKSCEIADVKFAGQGIVIINDNNTYRKVMQIWRAIRDDLKKQETKNNVLTT